MKSDLQPKFIFDFKSQSGNIESHSFAEPQETIIAYKHEDVLPALRRAEEAVKNGKYAGGYISYEASPAFNEAYVVRTDYKMPLLWFGIFDHCMEADPINIQNSSPVPSDWELSVTYEQYENAISTIKQLIEEGYSYQLNYTIRMFSEFKGDCMALYKHLADMQKSSYSAYLDCGEYKVLSASPELFFMKYGDQIKTQPMKGTIDVGRWLEESEINAQWLSDSKKDRAENLMIVDLLRNDLGRVSIPGSIRVPSLFQIERYPTVYQMTSTICSSVKPEVSIDQIFSALFPCGSITGAPKVSTMKSISELEDTPREVYCGSIGLMKPDGQSIFNVAIRTVVIHSNTGKAQYGVGGAVTWDSTSEEEYKEVLTKSALLKRNKQSFQLLESLLLEDGKYHLLEKHIHRLASSAKYFLYLCDEQAVVKSLNEMAIKHSKGRYKVRLLLNQDGLISIERHVITPHPNAACSFIVAKEPIQRSNVFLYHKTTNREVYDYIRKQATEVFEVLMWNENKEITEFTTGNVIVEINNEWFTPRRDCGLLAGTKREELLEKDRVKERILTLQDLREASRIWYVNSVRGFIQVKLQNE